MNTPEIKKPQSKINFIAIGLIGAYLALLIFGGICISYSILSEIFKEKGAAKSSAISQTTPLKKQLASFCSDRILNAMQILTHQFNLIVSQTAAKKTNLKKRWEKWRKKWERQWFDPIGPACQFTATADPSQNINFKRYQFLKTLLQQYNSYIMNE